MCTIVCTLCKCIIYNMIYERQTFTGIQVFHCLKAHTRQIQTSKQLHTYFIINTFIICIFYLYTTLHQHGENNTETVRMKLGMIIEFLEIQYIPRGLRAWWVNRATTL